MKTFVEGEKEDPFLILGFGLQTYRTTIRSLVVFFFLATIISSPIIFIYANGGGINQDEQSTSAYGKYTLANLGYDKV